MTANIVMDWMSVSINKTGLKYISRSAATKQTEFLAGEPFCQDGLSMSSMSCVFPFKCFS